MNKFKNKNGAIMLFVSVSMLFLIIIAISVYLGTKRDLEKQEKDIEQIEEEYNKTELNEIYDKEYEKYSNKSI